MPEGVDGLLIAIVVYFVAQYCCIDFRQYNKKKLFAEG